MSPTLKDLRVNDYTRHKVYPDRRPASLADLVEVLKQEGAVEWVVDEDDVLGDPGRYLVFSLEGKQ